MNNEVDFNYVGCRIELINSTINSMVKVMAAIIDSSTRRNRQYNQALYEGLDNPRMEIEDVNSKMSFKEYREFLIEKSSYEGYLVFSEEFGARELLGLDIIEETFKEVSDWIYENNIFNGWDEFFEEFTECKNFLSSILRSIYVYVGIDKNSYRDIMPELVYGIENPLSYHDVEIIFSLKINKNNLKYLKQRILDEYNKKGE